MDDKYVGPSRKAFEEWREEAKNYSPPFSPSEESAWIAGAQWKEKVLNKAGTGTMWCPCQFIEPCNYACPCGRGAMSGGCNRCMRFHPQCLEMTHEEMIEWARQVAGLDD